MSRCAQIRIKHLEHPEFRLNMQAKKLPNGFNSIETSSKSTSLTQMFAISTLAIGASVGIAVAPAHAVFITNGQLSFNDGVLNTADTVPVSPATIVTPGSKIITPVAGNEFTASFNNRGVVVVGIATGDFSTPFPNSTQAVTASSVGLRYDSGSNYKTTGELVFDFGTSGKLSIASGATFLNTPQGATHSNFAYQGTTASFVNNFNTTVIPITSFNFDVDNIASNNPANLSPNGSYSLVTSIVGAPPTTAVPEPFTIIGTLVGGTAAVRMRKKLAATQK